MPLPGLPSRKGIPNKLKRRNLQQACEDKGYDPMEAMLEIAKGQLICLTCNGMRETLYVAVDENGTKQRDENGTLKTHVRLCESCLGTGYERMHVADLLKARISIFDKVVPSLKQVEHVDPDGVREKAGWKLVIVDPRQPLPLDPKVPPALQAKREE